MDETGPFNAMDNPVPRSQRRLTPMLADAVATPFAQARFAGQSLGAAAGVHLAAIVVAPHVVQQALPGAGEAEETVMELLLTSAGTYAMTRDFRMTLMATGVHGLIHYVSNKLL